MKIILKFIIKLYSRLISPFTPPSCRFHPTCSSYAVEAIEKHGSIKGSWLAIKRILKCHPFNKSDPFDPVP